MSAPGFYGPGVDGVEVMQTHISRVFLAGPDVYKVKKPVRFSFLDFSTLERRRHFCDEEVRLNRRLAPDVYLGVVGLRETDEAFGFCDADDPEACEVAVRMRRLPAERFLPALLARGEVDVATIDTIVARLVAFHRDADAGPEVRAAGEPSVLTRQMRDDFDEMDRFRDVTIAAREDDRIRRFCLDGVARREAQLRRRIGEGRVRDGHGDLHAEHVCLRTPADGGLAIFDCIEFNPAFRRRDVAGEIAFLAMDLDYRGFPELAQHVVSRYAADAGDPELPELIPLFACHRAYIRGKVDSLKAEEAEVDEADRERAKESACRHFALAYRYTWRETPVLLVVGGLSGTGKSTLARRLAERLGFAHIASDGVRKELAGLAPTDRVGAGDEPWLYGPDMSRRTYKELYGRGEALLAAGTGVVLDATFQRRIHRERARAVAERVGVPVLSVECTAPEEVVVQRLRARAVANDDPSDADERVYREQLRAYEAYSEDERSSYVRVDTEGGIDAAIERIDKALAGG